MTPGGGVDPKKRRHYDFTLWRAAGPRRLMKWASPWGEGYPGWHIECSAMSLKHLGEHVDVHTGGADLVFPHHEDEIAQSEGATGHQVVGAWSHAYHLLSEGRKMAKSAGNFYVLADLVQRGADPLAFRYLALQTRYREPTNFTWEALAAADRGLERADAQDDRHAEDHRAPPHARIVPLIAPAHSPSPTPPAKTPAVVRRAIWRMIDAIWQSRQRHLGDPE